MSSLIANQVKINMCFSFNYALLIVRTNLCATYNLYNNYNNNCSFVIFICLQPFCKPHLFIILLTRTTICYSAHNRFVSSTLIRQIFTAAIFKHAASHKADCITTDSLPTLSCLFICAHLQSAECSQSRRYGFSPSQKLYCDRLYMCLFILVCPSCLLLLVYLEVIRCIVSVYSCIVYTLFCCVCVIDLFHG